LAWPPLLLSHSSYLMRNFYEYSLDFSLRKIILYIDTRTESLTKHYGHSLSLRPSWELMNWNPYLKDNLNHILFYIGSVANIIVCGLRPNFTGITTFIKVSVHEMVSLLPQKPVLVSQLGNYRVDTRCRRKSLRPRSDHTFSTWVILN